MVNWFRKKSEIVDNNVSGSGDDKDNCIDVVFATATNYYPHQWLTDDEFEDAVANAWDSIPQELSSKLYNLNVLIEDEPEERYKSNLPPNTLLLGLYVGVPLTKRDNYGLINSPDVIHIYKNPIFMVVGSREQALEQVRRTVLHEVGHYFGLDDNRLRELGY